MATGGRPTDSPAAKRRRFRAVWRVVWIVCLMLVGGGVYLKIRHAPPVFPPAASLRAERVQATPYTGTVHVTPEEAMSAAQTDGLSGTAISIQLVHLKAFGYRGSAWEVSAVDGSFPTPSGPVLHGPWVVLFFSPRTARLIGWIRVNT